ncbi:MAG: ribose 5-phosphate isomerase B [Ruminococcaceae bacterium]|nr:ribose 5-phosphate isomerase B [Oscillospiraceae bacterium]
MIYLGADHGGYSLKESIKKHLDERGIRYVDCGTDSPESVDYALIAKKTCDEIIKDKDNMGILCCGTGIGISMAANKVNGIRAACCSDYFSAKFTRLHNNANVLCMGGRVVGKGLANELVDVFLDTGFEGGRHQRRIDQLTDIENSQK